MYGNALSKAGITPRALKQFVAYASKLSESKSHNALALRRRVVAKALTKILDPEALRERARARAAAALHRARETIALRRAVTLLQRAGTKSPTDTRRSTTKPTRRRAATTKPRSSQRVVKTAIRRRAKTIAVKQQAATLRQPTTHTARRSRAATTTPRQRAAITNLRHRTATTILRQPVATTPLTRVATMVDRPTANTIPYDPSLTLGNSLATRILREYGRVGVYVKS